MATGHLLAPSKEEYARVEGVYALVEEVYAVRVGRLCSKGRKFI